MKHYIFLTSHYLPKPSATGYCVHRVAEELSKRGYLVTVICYEEDNDVNHQYGIEIKGVKIPNSLKSPGQGGRFQHIFQLFYKLINLKNYPLRSKLLASRFFEKIEQSIINPKETVLIATFNPIEAVYAMYLLKRKITQVKCVYYSTDSLSNEGGTSGIFPLEIRKEKGIQWEKKLFGICDLIIIMECHKKHYFANRFTEFENKMRLANFPLLCKSSDCNNMLLNPPLIVYAGSLSKKMRNPGYTLYLFKQIQNTVEFRLVFMGAGDCDDEINDARKQLNDKFDYLGLQPHDVAFDYLNKANYLLSIGNAKSEMAPSKIYEYMATGKPIIHIYNYEKDPCIEPLKKYGNSLLIKENQPNAGLLLKDFFSSYSIIPFMEVENIFLTSTPKYTADIIQEL